MDGHNTLAVSGDAWFEFFEQFRRSSAGEQMRRVVARQTGQHGSAYFPASRGAYEEVHVTQIRQCDAKRAVQRVWVLALRDFVNLVNRVAKRIPWA